MTVGFLALVLCFVIGVVLYPMYINYLRASTAEQKVSEYALDDFKEKQSTVTFGGVLFIVVPILITIILLNVNLNARVIIMMFVFLAYGALGFVDDYKIIKEGKNDGLTAKTKFIAQLAIATIFYFVYINTGGNNVLHFHLIGKSIDLGWLYFPFVIFMFAAFSNAVNLTDGMDGLSSGTSIIAFIPFVYFAFLNNQYDIATLLLAVIGGLFSYLVYNYFPAKIIMGDVGSLALGALFAVTAVYLEFELLSIIIGGVFVFETITVVIQQLAVRIWKKRVFKYTPIHYSFVISGWKEVSVVHFFWLLGLICSTVGTVIGMIAWMR